MCSGVPRGGLDNSLLSRRPLSGDFGMYNEQALWGGESRPIIVCTSLERL